MAPAGRANPELSTKVSEIVAGHRWIFDSWGHESVRRMMWSRADTVVWLDYPPRIVVRRVLHRSVVRTITRKRIFGGNRETLTGWFSRTHPVWYALTHSGRRRADIEALVNSHPRLALVRLIDHDDAERWLASFP